MIIFDFWLLAFILVFTAFEIVSSELENFAIGTGTFIVGLVGLQWLFGVPIWESIIYNPMSVLLYIVLYAIAGAVYTLLWRWPEFIRDNAVYINKAHAGFMKDNELGTREQFFASSYYEFTATKRKQSIATWMLTWPFSMAWELARKPAKYLFNTVYAMLGDVFETVGRRITSRILNK